MGRVGVVGDLAPSPDGGAAVELLTPCNCASELHPGVVKIVVSCGVVRGYDGGVGGGLPGLSHGSTGQCPMYGFGGSAEGGEEVDQGVAQPGCCVVVMEGSKECICRV